MREDCERKRFIEEDCEPCEEQTTDAPRREIGIELIEQAKLIETFGVLVPRLDERLRTVLYADQEKDDCSATIPPTTELGKELHGNNERISRIIERLNSIVARIEL